MRRFLQNRNAVIGVIAVLVVGAAVSWTVQLADSSGAPGSSPTTGEGVASSTAAAGPGGEPGGSPGGGGEGTLQIRTLEGEGIADLAARLGLGPPRLPELAALNQTPPADDPRLVMFPRPWVAEMKPPRDPFLWPAEEQSYLDRLVKRTISPLEVKPPEPEPEALIEASKAGALEVVVVGEERGGGALAVGNRVLRVGERLGVYTVVRVTTNGAFLRDDDGAERWLSFNHGVQRKRVAVEVIGVAPEEGRDDGDE